MMSEIYEMQYTLVRDDEDGEQSHVHMLVVEYGIEPAEYEGRHLFYAGGPYTTSVKDTSGNDFTLSDEEEQELLAYLARNNFIPAHHYPADY